ncbi:pre-mRNA-splicing factor prp46 [Lunasporangiospora selenospora]|uniref:Pre-mRNA-splicing factor prp46 n=1 Tax=Lunasporangiospora selenospora TaxID=979761 RepID=A0A9P6G1F5_9FUNG|nr:pre-mRNA-splicing factor prp46 [Lunasporangiospora selenospora]
MGTRTPSKSMDSSLPHYTQSPSPTSSSSSPLSPVTKRRSSASKYSHDIDLQSPANSKRRRKKSKKDRYEYNVDQDLDDEVDHGESGSPPPPTPPRKLPTIKISLKLPTKPSIISTPEASSGKKYATGRKRRSSEKLDIESGDEDAPDSNNEQDSDVTSPTASSHKRKRRKHKHKHKRKSSRHELQESGHQDEDEENVGRYPGDSDQEEAQETSKLTLRLGKTSRPQKVKTTLADYSSKNHQRALDEENDDRQSVTPRQSTSRSRSRSLSYSVNGDSPLAIKQEEMVSEVLSEAQPRPTHGQKKPFSSLSHEQRPMSQESEVVTEAEDDLEDNEDQDDPLAGDLDEPDDEDDEADEDDDDEDEDDDDDDDDDSDEQDSRQQSEMDADERSEDENSMSSSQWPNVASKSPKAGQVGSKTLPGARAPTNSLSGKTKKPKQARDTSTREGSVPSASTPPSLPVKGAKKHKVSRRTVTPKPSTPTVPKKKELSIVCHKLLDGFIKRDAYVLFTHPVDPELVPDYSSVIKNPMDFSTMRSKIGKNFYPTADEFLADFKLVCDNARTYNAKETLYWRQADKLWEWGSKAIDRERKNIIDKDEELLRSVKEEETLDVVGMGDHHQQQSPSAPIPSYRMPMVSIETAVDSPMSIAESRSHTPQQYRKSKKIKYKRDGTIAFSYTTDGSIDPASHPDPWSLVPKTGDFGSAPLLCPLLEANPVYNGQYLDDYPYWNVPMSNFRPANHQDYGPYAILEKPKDIFNNSGVQNIPAYTGMVFGDEKGEAYVRSLVMFLDGIVTEEELASMPKEDTTGLMEVRDHIHKKVETLTRGASTIVDKVASVIREEKTGKPSGVDTRVSLSLWCQDSNTSPTVDSSKPTTTPDKGASDKAIVSAEASAKDQEEETKAETETAKDVEMEDVDTEQDETKEPIKDEKGVDENPLLSTEDTPKAPEEMVDIRRVLQDIRAWPAAQRARNDYQLWRQQKIELTSLLPAKAVIGGAVADEAKVLWGETWKSDDSEESKKWVKEYLDQNTKDIKEALRLSATTTTANSTAVPGSLSVQNTPTLTPLAASGEGDKAPFDSLVKDIRTRLIEMAKYVPLSQVDPNKLPPPVVPKETTPAPASTNASSPAPVSTPASTGVSSAASTPGPVVTPVAAGSEAVAPATIPSTPTTTAAVALSGSTTPATPATQASATPVDVSSLSTESGSVSGTSTPVTASVVTASAVSSVPPTGSSQDSGASA